MTGITTIERLLLESLGQGPKEIPALMVDTQLDLRILSNVLHALTLRSFVIRTTEGYALNKHLSESERKSIDAFDAKKSEVMELISGLYNQHSNQLRVRKVAMTDKDRTILRGLLKNVEDFVSGLPAPTKHAPTHSWSVVAWGEDKYSTIVQRLIGEA